LVGYHTVSTPGPAGQYRTFYLLRVQAHLFKLGNGKHGHQPCSEPGSGKQTGKAGIESPSSSELNTEGKPVAKILFKHGPGNTFMWVFFKNNHDIEMTMICIGSITVS